jgi:DNA-binding NtrC family response regulator
VGRLKVLVVDDDRAILRALSLSLEDIADVTTLDTVAAALPLVERGRFDVVVADLRMPDRWGDELLAHVAARAPATRRLLLTGDLDPERTVRELLEVGVVEAWFQKPRAEGLLETIRATLTIDRAPPAPSA